MLGDRQCVTTKIIVMGLGGKQEKVFLKTGSMDSAMHIYLSINTNILILKFINFDR